MPDVSARREPVVLRFGPFEVNAAQMELRKHGIRLKLAARPFRVLLLLLRRPGEVVERDEIRKELWGEDTFVDFDRNLNLCISQVRAALSDDASAPAYIETIPRLGYRFTGELETPLPQVAEVVVAVVPAPATGKWKPVLAGFVVALFLVAGAGVFYVARRVPAAAALRITPLTGFGGQVQSPSFSPDGERVAFTWQPAEMRGRHVYVKLVDSGEPLQLTDGAATEDSPVWSADGSRVAFVREDESGRAIWAVPALGGVPQRVYGFNQRRIFHWLGQPMAWLDSGDWLVSDRELTAGGAAGPILPLRIYRMRDGARVAAVTGPPDDWWGDVAPSVSPDGEWFAFLRGASFSMASLWVQRLNGAPGSERMLLQGAVGLSGTGWSPDSQSVYVGGELEQGTGIWRVPLAGGPPQQVTAAARPLQGVTVSRQKGRAAFTEANNRPELWSLAIGGGAGSVQPVSAAGGHAQQPRLSPDGERIVFVSTRSGTAELWMAGRDGRGLVQLTRSVVNPSSPQWSPEGGRIAFMALVDNDAEIFVMEAGGGRPQRLTSSPGLDSMPSWSADGRWVYFSSKRGGAMDIWKTRGDGQGAAVRVTRHGGHHPLEWNGHIYYRPDMIRPGVRRVAVGGGEERPVWEGRFSDWAVGRSGLYLLVDAGLGRLDAERRQWLPVVALPPGDVAGFALSPDERQLVFARVKERLSEIMVVHNLR